ncbi:hypothetical protein [Streptomyces sp. NPDC053431]|uniref:hypothetical protein n=1 Tax=Streptomyces sp. NPDC053431 TaxID=3365703 RepID=UPI0037D4CD15
MTKKTRVRVARIAAGVVIAAGASLTAAGAAQAVGVSVSLGAEDEPPTCEIDPTLCQTTPPTTEPTTAPPTTEPTTAPPTTEPTTAPPTTEPTTAPPTTAPPTTQPTGHPTGKPTGKPTPGKPGPTGQPTTPGDDDNDNGAGTCTVDLDGAECVDNDPGTNNAGSQPVEQGKAKEELAETGAAETSFLIIGAATMIAGGIGFRFLPRLAAGGRTAA